ncbi:transporter substrate-binding domain-containing protein [Brucella pseudogrignonensis]|uniref:transporter substrate-binding domain-containing protein n=1 Tax=Brucella pseudogrignonensis TaxID=419475 RepID=UPI003D980467
MIRKKIVAALISGMVGISVAQAEEVSVAFLSDLPPFGFTENGKLIGFDIDIWQEIAKDIKVDYKPMSMDFGAMIPALQTGNIDVAMASMFITNARKEIIDFSQPYYISDYGVLAHKDDNSIQKPEDLDGKSIATVTGSAAAAWVRQNMPTAKVTLLPNVANALLEFKTGRVDTVIYDYPTLAYYARTEGSDASRVLKQSVGDRFDVGIAFPKDSQLVGRVDDALANLRKDGRYDAIHQKWFGVSHNSD